MAAVPPLPPSTAIFRRRRQKFFIAFLAELGNLESSENMFFFFKKFFSFITNPAGNLVIFFKFSFFKVYLRFNTSPVLLKILQQNVLWWVSKVD